MKILAVLVLSVVSMYLFATRNEKMPWRQSLSGEVKYPEFTPEQHYWVSLSVSLVFALVVLSYLIL